MLVGVSRESGDAYDCIIYNSMFVVIESAVLCTVQLSTQSVNLITF